MNCPGCGAPTTVKDPKAACESCGFPVGELRTGLTLMYVLTGAFFMTALGYCAIVALMKVPVRDGGAGQTLLQVLGAVAVLDGLVVAVYFARIPEFMTAMEARQRLIMQLAFSESVVIFGMILYFLTGRMQTFVMFLAGGLVLFVIVGMRVPRLGLAMRRHLYAEWEMSRNK